MILVFAAAGTGAVDMAAPLTAAHQPKLIRLACALYREDGEEVGGYHAIIKPKDWTLTADDKRRTGVSHSDACAGGMDPKVILAQIRHFQKSAGEIVAYDLAQQELLVSCGMVGVGWPGQWVHPGIKRTCLRRIAERLEGQRRPMWDVRTWAENLMGRVLDAALGVKGDRDVTWDLYRHLETVGAVR